MKVEFNGGRLTARAENDRENNVLLGVITSQEVHEREPERSAVTPTQRNRIWVKGWTTKDGVTAPGRYRTIRSQGTRVIHAKNGKTYTYPKKYVAEDGRTYKNRASYMATMRWNRERAIRSQEVPSSPTGRATGPTSPVEVPQTPTTSQI